MMAEKVLYQTVVENKEASRATPRLLPVVTSTCSPAIRFTIPRAPTRSN